MTSTEHPGSLNGRVAVVTGAGRMRSIGRAVALAMAEAGCDVVLTGTGRDPARYPEDEKAAGWRDIASVADEIRSRGRRALPLVCDARDPAAVERLLRETLDGFGRVDFVINNAGAARGEDRKPVVDLAIEDWKQVLDVNLNGSFYMSKVFARRLIEQGNGGAIINISSIAGKLFGANTAAYAASKAGIHALTACMANELGAHNIRVNAICPGIIDTFRMDDLGRGDTWNAMVRARIPLGRAGTGADVANMVVFLCSPSGSWITGQAYNVDGGTVVQH